MISICVNCRKIVDSILSVRYGSVVICDTCKKDPLVAIYRNDVIARFKLKVCEFATCRVYSPEWRRNVSDDIYLLRDILEASKRATYFLPDTDPKKRAYLRECELYDEKRVQVVSVDKLQEKVIHHVKELIAKCHIDPLYPLEKNIRTFTENTVVDTSIQEFTVAMKIVDDIMAHHNSTQQIRDNKRRIDKAIKKGIRTAIKCNSDQLAEYFDIIKRDSDYENYKQSGVNMDEAVKRIVEKVKYVHNIKIQNAEIIKMVNEMFPKLTYNEEDVKSVRAKLPMNEQDIESVMETIMKNIRRDELRNALTENNIPVGDIINEGAYMAYVNGDIADLEWTVGLLKIIHCKNQRMDNMKKLFTGKLDHIRLKVIANDKMYVDYIENGNGNINEVICHLKDMLNGIVNRVDVDEKWKQWTKVNRIPSHIKLGSDEFFGRWIEKMVFDLMDDEMATEIKIDNGMYTYAGYRFIELRCEQLDLDYRKTSEGLFITKKK